MSERCDCCKMTRPRTIVMRPDAVGDTFRICDLCAESVFMAWRVVLAERALDTKDAATAAGEVAGERKGRKG